MLLNNSEAESDDEERADERRTQFDHGFHIGKEIAQLFQSARFGFGFTDAESVWNEPIRVLVHWSGCGYRLFFHQTFLGGEPIAHVTEGLLFTAYLRAEIQQRARQWIAE